jgi:CRP-like cAMP-binding protein
MLMLCGPGVPAAAVQVAETGPVVLSAIENTEHGARYLRVASESGQAIDPMRGAFAVVDSMRTVSSYRRDQEIYGRSDAAEYWYCVVSGAARKYALTTDGRRRIIDFLLPGDFFGFGARHAEFFAAEAIAGDTVVACYPRRRLEAAADSDPRLGRQIREISFEAISRFQARLLILGRVTSLEKVGAFLIEMAARSFDRADQTVVLPMSRYDIADYLAVSVETVSRALTAFKKCGAIRHVTTRRIRIVDSGPLESGVCGDRSRHCTH